VSLLLAVFMEHKQRTGHDFARRSDWRVACCDVCSALRAEKKREEMAEEAAELAAKEGGRCN